MPSIAQKFRKASSVQIELVLAIENRFSHQIYRSHRLQTKTEAITYGHCRSHKSSVHRESNMRSLVSKLQRQIHL